MLIEISPPFFVFVNKGFAAIENGSVPKALEDLTGGEAEEFFLGRESKGANKAKLWRQIQSFHRNG